MQVTDVKIHIVSVPLVEPETWRFGRLWGLTSAVVEVETDEGVTGLGETLGSPYIKLVVEAIRKNAEWLKGKDPLAIRSFISELAGPRLASLSAHWAYGECRPRDGTVGHHRQSSRAAASPSIRWRGARSCSLLLVHDVLDRTPEGVRRQAREGVDRGFRTV